MEWFAFDVEESGVLRECREGWRLPPSYAATLGERMFIWVPTQTVVALSGGYWERKMEPLLPGYALAGGRIGWARIEQTLGFRLLRHGSTPRPLREAEVCRLAVACSEQRVEQVQRLEPGAAVRVAAEANSPFAGLDGVFRRHVSVPGGLFASVMIRAFGRSKLVVVPADYLEYTGGG